MDLLEQPDIKITYEKCKYIVKLWEHKFKKKHNRLPSKLDIREANIEVRNAYRKYFQLKTAALEQSFKDVEGFEDFDNDDCQDNETTECLQTNEASNPEPTVTNYKESTDDGNDVEMSEIPNQIPDGVWGAHLNNKPDEKKASKAAEKANPNQSISKKLFCGSKFTKRNPRKSLSFSQKNKSNINLDTSLSLSQPNFEIQSSFQSEEVFNLNENIFGGESFHITKTVEKIVSQPINIVQSVVENSYNRQLKSVDAGWLERVTKKDGKSLGLTLHSESLAKENNYVNSEIESTKIDYDSDIIEESDNESPDKDLASLHILKKRKIDTKKNQLNQTSNLPILNNFNKENNLVKKTEEIEKNKNVFKEKQVENLQIEIELKNNDKSLKIYDNKVEPEEYSKAKIQKRKTAVRKLKTAINSNKKEKRKINSENEEISPRRSNRSNRFKVSMEETPIDEETDPFYSDNDDKDPVFDLNSEKTKKKTIIYNDDSDETTPEKTKKDPKPAKKLTKSVKKLTKTKKVKEDEEQEKDSNDSKPYELEFSVKPRIVAPRYKNLKKVIKENKIVTKGDTNGQEDKNGEQVDVSLVKDKRQRAKEALEKKVASGKLNENFVQINLKKKIYARGKKANNYSKYKKALWKTKKAKALAGPDMDMGGCDGGTLTCFRCGQTGHFAQKCTTKMEDALLPLTAEQEEECPFPTLEEASQMAKESVLSIRKPKLKVGISETQKSESEAHSSEQTNGEVNSDNESENRESDSENNKDEDSDFGFEDDDFTSEELLRETLRLEEHVRKLDVRQYMDSINTVKPYFELDEDGSVIETPKELYEALNKFGHDSFRPGQEQAIMRILSGKSTLVTLSTGSGKSLCYQLPAYLYSTREPCISLIISPLVSLMDDQVAGLPKFLKAACLHSNQTKTQREKILERISLGELSFLLISPEAVVAGEKQSGFGSLLRKLPPIAFACIDEAHCVSQWSHNFRPSYLMICRVLRESLGVKTILGLTATATRATKESIIDHLQIPDGFGGVITDIPLPDNLTLTVSKDHIRDQALLGLLTSERFTDCKSIIVYCTRRDECERIASFLRTSLKTDQNLLENPKKRKRLNVQAEPYHAGLPASRRRTIQNRFMSGELRIVVATVAFGMGINKSDIRAVIHFNMPNSFESYVQEVGRAGRDGLKAHCHVFLDSEGRDENELRRHIYANSIDRHVISKLLRRIFVPCSCSGVCPKHEVAFSIEETIRLLDLPEENISTLLCYLELHENKYIQLLSPAYTFCKVISYGGPLQIRKAAKECTPLAMALALHKSAAGKDPNVLEFPVVDVAAAMGWESGICKHKLKNLEWTTVNGQQKRSSLTVQFSNLGFRLFAPGNLSDDQLDEALDNLYQRVVDQEKKALLQLNCIHQTLNEVAKPSYRACVSQDGDDLIKSRVRGYFDSSDPLKFADEVRKCNFSEKQLVADINAIVCMYRDNAFTGRAIARIFQGIQSPNYPAVIWGRCKFWRSYLHVDFNEINKIATREIIRMRQNKQQE